MTSFIKNFAISWKKFSNLPKQETLILKIQYYYLPSVEIETLTVGAEIALGLHYFHLKHFCLVVISSFAVCVLIVYFDLYLNTPVKQKGYYVF